MATTAQAPTGAHPWKRSPSAHEALEAHGRSPVGKREERLPWQPRGPSEVRMRHKRDHRVQIDPGGEERSKGLKRAVQRRARAQALTVGCVGDDSRALGSEVLSSRDVEALETAASAGAGGLSMTLRPRDGLLIAVRAQG